jgi:hypothetical protein
MRNPLPLLGAAAIALAIGAAPARAQSVELRLSLPVVLPPLVVIEPGIQVVSDVDHEVFFVERVYWTRHGGRWYRSASPRGGWVVVERGVPPGLVRLPPGKYKKWKPAKAQYRRDDRRERHDGDHGRGRGRGGDDRHGDDHDDGHGKGKHGGKHGKD